MVFKRTKAYAWIFTILFIAFIPVVTWLFISLFANKASTKTLLVIMITLCLCLDILFLILSIIYILQKKDAITVQDKQVILKTYKEKVLEFKDIKDVKRHSYYFGGKGYFAASSIGLLSSGYIEFTLNNGNKVYIKDIKNVKKVCRTLRETILDIKN